MAKTNSTEIHREIAAKLNPYIGHSTGQTLENVQTGMEFLSTAVASLNEACGDEEFVGFSASLRAMSAALAFEQTQPVTNDFYAQEA